MAANPPDPRMFGVTQQLSQRSDLPPEEKDAGAELAAERRGPNPQPAPQGWARRLWKRVRQRGR
jgi:hypothetical protein